MVEEQLRPRGIRDERVLQAMAALPREEFVPRSLRRHAYDDRALGIGGGQTISQPLVVALVAEALAPQPGDLALEVGGGSGYLAAVLSRLVRGVVAVELLPELAAAARERLKRLGIENVEVRAGDGTRGAADRAPFEVIAVSAAASKLPEALAEQLAEGGRMVIPLAAGDDFQELTRFEKRRGELAARSLGPVSFVPLIEPAAG
jgi:protein-L-isoaspartate(D-aspartate) O-methyltransferase